MKKLGLILFLFVLLLPATVSAQAGERIRNFDSDIYVDPQNVAHISETITYDFGANQRHGIFRNIPLKKVAAGDEDKFFFYDLAWESVTQDGSPAITQNEGSDDEAVLRIGDPNKKITGKHTYVVNYRIWPVAQEDERGDVISWNITGNGWNVPIDKAIGNFSFDEGTYVINSRCYTGPTGSLRKNCKKKESGGAGYFTSAENLGAYEGLTAQILVTKDSFTNYLVAEEEPPVDLRPFFGVALGGFAFILGFILRFVGWLRYKRRRRDQTIVPQYSPPKGLSAGGMGLLYDNRSDMKEITATLIDMAVKGYIKIEQTKEKSLFKSAEYKFTLLKAKTGLNKHEKILADLLFPGKKTEVELKDVDKVKASKKVAEVKKILKQNVEDAGYRSTSTKIGFPQFVKRLYQVIALIILLWVLYVIFASTSQSGSLAIALPTTIMGLTMVLFGYLITKRVELSHKGYQKWGEIEGLVMYMTVAEKDRLEFHNAPKKNPKLFSELLPYAVALGVDKTWASQFKDLDVAKDIDWYTSQSTFNSVLLANSLSSDFNSSISRGFSAPSQSSGGFSGGSFSGGGGGGGGGGSW